MANEARRARSILGAIAEVAGELDSAKAEKFVRSVAEVYGPQRGLTPEQIAGLNAGQLGNLFIEVMRGFLLDIRRAATANAAAEAARRAALDNVDAVDAPDLGGR